MFACVARVRWSHERSKKKRLREMAGREGRPGNSEHSPANMSQADCQEELVLDLIKPMKVARTLSEFRSGSAVMLPKLQGFIREVQSDIGRLDSEFASWKEARDRHPADYSQHDARKEILVTLRTVAESDLLNYIFVRDYLTDMPWWKEKLEDVSEEKKVSGVREQVIMTKWFMFHAVAMALEETFRAIVRSGEGTFTVSPVAPYGSVYAHVLKVCGLERFIPLLEVLRLTRNTLHTNGFFFPADNKDREVSYEGEQFVFKVGEPLHWFGEEALLWLLEKARDSVTVIVRTHPISSLGYVPRGKSVGIGGE